MKQLEPIKKILLILVIAFIVVAIWTNPTGAAHTAGDFLHDVGSFFSTLIDKIVTFFRGLDD